MLVLDSRGLHQWTKTLIILSNQCIIIELLYALMELGLALHEKIIPERQGVKQYLVENPCA